ncbi:uncharacterized protein B0T23DRAFT_324704, partial [Neurospora hispaniola]
LDKVVYNILKKDFIIGLFYIVVSRTYTIKGIIFNKSFEINALCVTNTKIYIYTAIDIVRRIF